MLTSTFYDSNTSAVTSIKKSRLNAQLGKLRDTPVERFHSLKMYERILWIFVKGDFGQYYSLDK